MLGRSSSLLPAIFEMCEFESCIGKGVGVKKRLVRKRKSSLHAAAFATEVMWSDLKVAPNIDILSQNSNELETKEMSGRKVPIYAPRN